MSSKEIKKAVEELTFDELYKSVVDVLINGTKAQQKKMWKVLNEGKGDFLWIRLKIITDTLRKMDAKTKESFSLDLMKGHVKSGYFTVMKEDFIDEETGIKYRQFKRVDGKVHRVPYYAEGMDSYAYKKAERKMFLGDSIESHCSDGTTTYTPLDTPEKVKDYNDGVFYEKHVYKRNKPK